MASSTKLEHITSTMPPEEDWATAIGYMHKNIGEVHTCGFRVMWVGRKTNRKTDNSYWHTQLLITTVCTSSGSEVTIIIQNYSSTVKYISAQQLLRQICVLKLFSIDTNSHNFQTCSVFDKAHTIRYYNMYLATFW